jgi:hypothetical protein
MSFEVFVQCFQNGEFAGIPRQCVRDAFGTHLTETAWDFWQLHYDETNSCDLHLTTPASDPSMVQGFTVHRPCADLQLWNALASVLALGDVVLYSPGGRAPLVARAGVAKQLPLRMVQALGEPVVVASGRDIQREVRAG